LTLAPTKAPGPAGTTVEVPSVSLEGLAFPIADEPF
jgi:hypothetical protein